MLPKKVLAVNVVHLIIIEERLKINKTLCCFLWRYVSIGLNLSGFFVLKMQPPIEKHMPFVC